jgi:hypothetical protein
VNGIEFYWDQHTLRYLKRHDENFYDITKDKYRLDQPKSALVRLTSSLLKRRGHQQTRRKINDTQSQTTSNNSTNILKKHVRINIQSAHNAGRGILPKRSK